MSTKKRIVKSTGKVYVAKKNRALTPSTQVFITKPRSKRKKSSSRYVPNQEMRELGVALSRVINRYSNDYQSVIVKDILNETKFFREIVVDYLKYLD